MSEIQDRVRELGLPRRVTLGDALAQVAESFPDEIGWVFEEERVSFSGMKLRVDMLVASLTRFGIARGDRIAVWLPNHSQWAVGLLACARIGAVLVALNTRWKSSEAAYVLQNSQPRLIILQRRFLKIDFQDLLEEIRTVTPTAVSSVELLIEVDDGVDGEPIEGSQTWEDFVAGSGDFDVERDAGQTRAPRPADVVLLQYTSGSTARPKGAMLSHVQILNYGVEILLRLGVTAGDRYLNTQPLYHVGGSCTALPVPLTLRCCVVTPLYYTAERVLALIQRERCVARGGSATMYFDEMYHPRFREYDTSSLRSGWTGAPPSVCEDIRTRYPIPGLVNLYGASEGGGTCGSIDDGWEKRRDTVGKPLTGTEIRIANLDGTGWAKVDEMGEIGFRGWNQITEYFNDPETTARAVDAEGFMRIGDLGFLDEEGYLHYSGRIKDMIRPGGENVAAEEVESYISKHPLIKQVAVIGAPDARMGEVVVAVVEEISPGTVSEEDVIRFCRAGMANFRVPKRVHFVTEWPLTGNGKILKPILRERFTTPAGAPVEAHGDSAAKTTGAH
jgi:fatty-acyl-CoA synthase/long-chain acyl-CoA synthetase